MTTERAAAIPAMPNDEYRRIVASNAGQRELAIQAHAARVAADEAALETRRPDVGPCADTLRRQARAEKLLTSTNNFGAANDRVVSLLRRERDATAGRIQEACGTTRTATARLLERMEAGRVVRSYRCGRRTFWTLVTGG